MVIADGKIQKTMEILRRFWLWIKHWLWDKPTSKPPKEQPIRLKASEVAKEYMVVSYHGQRINMHRSEYPMWKLSSRKDKRAMKNKFEKFEKEGLVRFETIEGFLICIQNLDYQVRADKLKAAK